MTEREQFPANSRRPVRPQPQKEEKHIQQISTGPVRRRKVPLGKRLSRNLLGSDAQSVWSYMAGDVLAPAARDMVADALIGGVQRAIFGDTAPRRSTYRGGPVGHVAYNRVVGSTGRPTRNERGRDISRRARATHDFDEIILESRIQADEVLRQMDDLLSRYSAVSVKDLYEMVGITAAYTDERWGWLDLDFAAVSRVRDGYLLNLPRPEPI